MIATGTDNSDVNERNIIDLAAKVGRCLQQKGLRIVSAESCTGGWLGQAITAIEGSSAWYEHGFITYSNYAKHKILGVSLITLEKYGAVSEITAQEMALGAQHNSRAQVSVAITGIAGPSGGNEAKPVGTVCFAWFLGNSSIESKTYLFSGNREAVRRQSVIKALRGLLNLLGESS